MNEFLLNMIKALTLTSRPASSQIGNTGIIFMKGKQGL